LTSGNNTGTNGAEIGMGSASAAFLFPGVSSSPYNPPGTFSYAFSATGPGSTSPYSLQATFVVTTGGSGGANSTNIIVRLLVETATDSNDFHLNPLTVTIPVPGGIGTVGSVASSSTTSAPFGVGAGQRMLIVVELQSATPTKTISVTINGGLRMALS
jgi:hypothetical protein